MDAKPLRIAQVSDIHLFSDKNNELLGVKTYDSLSAALDLLKKEPIAPDLILLTGDLSQDYSEGAYLAAANFFKNLHCPIYYIPGNHDDSNVMARGLPRDNFVSDRHIVKDTWQIILLDSHQHGRVEGYLSRSELDFMQTCLQKYPDKKAMIVFHHHPVAVGCGWLDPLGVLNSQEFWSTIELHANAQVVIFGHVHQEKTGAHKHIQYFSAPSTCIQFKRNSHEFALEALPPGYRWIELYSNGEIKTRVERAAHYVGVFDVNATGY